MNAVQTQTSPKSTGSFSLRVAVATRGYGIVNQHFGHANCFQIYDVKDSEAIWLEERPVTSYCHGPEDGPGDLDAILQTLKDCQAVLVSRIGHGPDDRLRKAGIEPVLACDTIETALFELYANWPR
ncbi:MAG: dinitrogenase iron-molybdenum cofactor [Cyanobacteria bacterium SID2]|nr:dinitrogenase iron-molybdenum cofactor [Cyanobacteria bacterium SID2]MBP0003896.1 dinitrogenase iron-molybdenum cofactor [Cyanobacteria bacterium SBC]